VAVGGVLDDRQLGGIAQDLVQGEGRVAFGRDDDLGAVGRVLVRDVGVAGEPLVDEVARQRPPGERLGPHGQAQPV
jgi:hypothetical protein